MASNNTTVLRNAADTLRLRGPNLHHVAWLKFLLSLPDSASIARAARAVGTLQYITSPRARKKIERRYEDFLVIAAPYAAERGITLPDHFSLARKNYVDKPLCSIAPALVTLAKTSQIKGLFEATGFERAEEVYRSNPGMVLCAMHQSAMGVAVSYASRLWDAPLTTLRDAQFQVFENTEYGKGYFLGAETLFVNGSDVVSSQSALMKCARRLRNHHLVAYTPDSFNGSRSRMGTILGRPAFVKTGIAALAAGAKAPLCFAKTVPRGDKLHVSVTEPIFLDGPDPESQFAEAYMKWVESSLLESPEIIFWLRYYRELFDPHSAGVRDLPDVPRRPDTEFKRPKKRKSA